MVKIKKFIAFSLLLLLLFGTGCQRPSFESSSTLSLLSEEEVSLADSSLNTVTPPFHVFAEEKGLGVLNSTKKVVIPPIYAHVLLYQLTSGEWVAVCELKAESDVVESYSPYWGRLQGLLSMENEEILPFTYSNIKLTTFQGNDAAWVSNEERMWGVVSLKNETLIPLSYLSLKKVSDDLLEVGQNYKYGYIDNQENILLPPQYDKLWNGNQRENPWLVVCYRSEIYNNVPDAQPMSYDTEYYVVQYGVIRWDQTVIYKSPVFIVPMNTPDFDLIVKNFPIYEKTAAGEDAYRVYNIKDVPLTSLDVNGFYCGQTPDTFEPIHLANQPDLEAYEWNDTIPYILVPMPKG